MSFTSFKVDLHVHSCLSPCGDLEMSPQAIVRTAIEKGLSIIALSDHNTAENVQAVVGAAQQSGLTVIPGMEITSAEEVHILGLFPGISQALKIQERIYEQIPKSTDLAYIQEQVIASENDEVEGFCPYLLLGATPFTVRRIVDMIHEVDGLAIAAHIDRMAFGILNQLGFIPPQINFDALEISRHIGIENAKKRYPEYAHFSFVSNSDAHYLKDIAQSPSIFKLESPTFDEIRKAFRGEPGRSIAAVKE